MQEHLSDEQLIGRIEGTSTPEATSHAEGCAECRAEEEILRAGVSGWRTGVREGAERPAGFWFAQEQAIQGRLARRGTAQRLAWAVAMVTVALATALSFEPRQPARPPVPYDPDHELLVQVQESVRRPVPRALAPASLLAEDLREAAKPSLHKKVP